MSNEVYEYTSKAGTEIHAVFDNVKFGDLQMVKFATQRDMAPIHVMSRVDNVGIAKGKRNTSGACVFTIFEKDRLLEAIGQNPDKKVFLTNHELLNYGQGSGYANEGSLLKFGTRTPSTLNPDTIGNAGIVQESSIFKPETYGAEANAMLADQIPPFDITLVGISEVNPAGASRMVIHGVQFNSDQGGTSIDDLVLERQLTFLARRISPWKLLREVRNASSNQTVSPNNGQRFDV